MLQKKDELVPKISLDMNYKIMLAQRHKEILLEERQKIIENSIQTIQYNFFIIGRALAEIKQFKLYKADPLYPSWKEYVKNRIAPKLHQSTISDYISIVKMQLENDDFIIEDDLVRLGYKKVKLLKTKLSLIQKEKDPLAKRSLIDRFKKEYKKTFKEYKQLPYTTFEQIFEFVPSKKKVNNVIEKLTDNFHVKLDENRYTLTITSRNQNLKKLESIYDSLV